MYGLVITLILIGAVLLILIVLAQNPKGGGLSSQFGGPGTTQLMGVKKTGDLLEKLTWIFAIAILILSVSTTFLRTEPTDQMLSPNLEDLPSDNALSTPAIESTDALEDLGLTEPSAETDTSAN